MELKKVEKEVLKAFINTIKDYAASISYIESVIIVGSYTRETKKKGADLDIVIITSNKSEMIINQKFIQYFGEVHRKQTEYYGACTSIRVWYKSGQEVEFGIVEPSWIAKPFHVRPLSWQNKRPFTCCIR